MNHCFSNKNFVFQKNNMEKSKKDSVVIKSKKKNIIHKKKKFKISQF